MILSSPGCAQVPPRGIKEICWWLEWCSALGVVLRLLLYEHSRLIAYPAATVQAGDPQGNQTVPRLQETMNKTLKYFAGTCLTKTYNNALVRIMYSVITDLMF